MADAHTRTESSPTISRFVLSGLVIGAVIGCATGVVLGLIAYPPTAWAAAIEVGLPAAVVGALVGLSAGVIVTSHRRRLHR